MTCMTAAVRPAAGRGTGGSRLAVTSSSGVSLRGGGAHAHAADGAEGIVAAQVRPAAVVLQNALFDAVQVVLHAGLRRAQAAVCGGQRAGGMRPDVQAADLFACACEFFSLLHAALRLQRQGSLQIQAFVGRVLLQAAAAQRGQGSRVAPVFAALDLVVQRRLILRIQFDLAALDPGFPG